VDVDRLRFAVVPLVAAPVVRGDRARGFVVLVPPVRRLVEGGFLAVAHRAVDTHQVVVRVQVLRVDRQRLLVGLDRLGIAAGEPLDRAEVVPGDAVKRELSEDEVQIALGVIEPAFLLGDDGSEERRLAPARAPLVGLHQRALRVLEAAFGDLGARAIQGPVRLLRRELRHAGPGAGGALVVALEEEADAVVVPAQPRRVGVAAFRSVGTRDSGLGTRLPPSASRLSAHGKDDGVGG
jgi:hypothetical protein